MEKFTDLGLSPAALEALRKKGFEEPTEIQCLTIPALLEDTHDLIAQAQTGTGKTAAFALPLLEKIKPSDKGVQAIILAPTRELVIQICEEINSLQKSSGLSVSPIYGGQSMELQLKRLKKGVSIVAGTPGRVLDHLRRGSLDLKSVRFFILDEADEMLNMGFIDDIESILEKTPAEKRVCLFSATMPDRIKKLAEKYMGSYKHLKTKTQLTVSLTDQIYFEVAARDKFEALCRIIDIEPMFYGLIFCRTRNDVDQLTHHLIERGYAADGLHGDISQAQRERILGKFRKQGISILVATDVAARGIDVDHLTHVINYSIPQNPEAYIHRIGRTGRAGRQGTAITFITPSEFRALGFIKRIAKADIRKATVPKVDEIILARKQKITDEIEKIAGNQDTDGYRKWAKRIIGEHPPEEVVAALLKYAFGSSMDESSYKKITPLKEKTERRASFVEEEGQTRLFIAKGSKDNMTRKKLVDMIVEKTGTPGNLIEDVEVMEDFSFITVPFVEAEMILKKFLKSKSGKKPIITRARAARPSRTIKSKKRRKNN